MAAGIYLESGEHRDPEGKLIPLARICEVYIDILYYPWFPHVPYSGTDNANVILTSWNDLCKIVCSDSSPELCKLGLQQARESLQLLSSHYLELRCASEQTLYSLLSKEYVPLIGKFIELLCIAVATKWKKAIAEDTAKPTEGEN